MTQENPGKIETDLFRMLSDFRLPSMPNMDALVEAQRRNLEAISTANKVALEGAQSVAKRHLEIMQSSLAELSSAVQATTTAGAPHEKALQQAEVMRQAYEKAILNMKELAGLIQKSNDEALTVLNRRFADALEEVRGSMGKSG